MELLFAEGMPSTTSGRIRENVSGDGQDGARPAMVTGLRYFGLVAVNSSFQSQWYQLQSRNWGLKRRVKMTLHTSIRQQRLKKRIRNFWRRKCIFFLRKVKKSSLLRVVMYIVWLIDRILRIMGWLMGDDHRC